MSNVILKIDGVDRTEYFKGPLRVTPAGDGVVGSATIFLDQEAGGLDIRTMDSVQIYVPSNTTTNAGIAAKGRLFGGHVMKRGTTNRGTTKLWTLSCADNNVILKKSYRRAATVYAVPLAADTFAQQIKDLFVVLQGATPTTFIDADTHVADLYPTMPAVTYPGGHRWEWYVQELLKTVHTLDPAVFPSYYMGVSTTFGAIDTFGLPTLHVYDAASPPASSVAFSDTPTGAEKDVFEYLVRDTDATAMSQLQQSWWRGLVLTSTDTTSISTYPNPYDDHTGAWVDGDVIDDTASNSEDEAQALLDNLILAKGAPRDSFKWVTYERLVPGEYVDLKWDLEGIPAATQYRVAAATFEWEEPNVIKSTLTINTRRLGLFEDGGGFFARPIEGDNVPPLPAADFTLTTNEYNFTTNRAELTFAIDNTGASPDTAGYRIIGVVNGLPEHYDVGTDLTPTLTLAALVAFALRVVAYDNTGNFSETFPIPSDPAITGTTAGPPYHFGVPNPSFELFPGSGTSEPLYWDDFDTGTCASTRVSALTPYGRHMLQLVDSGTGMARRRSDHFLATGDPSNNYTLDFYAIADDDTAQLTASVVSWEYDGTTFSGVGSDTFSFDVTTVGRRYIMLVTPDIPASYITIQFTNEVGTFTVWVDDVQFKPQTITDGVSEALEFNFPENPTDGTSIFHPGHGVIVTYLASPGIWVGPERVVQWSDRYATLQPYSTNNDILYEYRIRTGKTLWVKEWSVDTHVVSPNTGSAFWTAALLKASDATDILSLNTSADSPNVWVEQGLVTSFTGNPFTKASVAGFAIQIRKTGAPGNIYIDFEFLVREVYG